MFGAGKLLGRLSVVAPALLVAGGWVDVASGQTRLDGRRDDRGGDLVNFPRVWVPPVIEKRTRTVWIAPKTEVVHRKVWHEPVFEERRVRVEVPAVTEWRRVAVYDSCGRVVDFRWEEVIVSPPCERWELQRVLVREGWYEGVCETVVVCPGRWETVCEDVVVREGYWRDGCANRPVPLIDDLPDHRPIPLIDDLRGHGAIEKRPAMPISIRPAPDRREYPVAAGNRPPTMRSGEERYGAFDRFMRMDRSGADAGREMMNRTGMGMGLGASESRARDRG